LRVSQFEPEVQKRSIYASESGSAPFTVPIRFGGIRRELPSSPGRYLILLRQRHRARINQPWKWGRFVVEL